MSVSTLHRPRSRARTRAQVIDKIAANFEVSDEGCWLWTGNLTNVGYAKMTWKPAGEVIGGGHRVVLHAIGQPVSRELDVDHLCRNRACINPDHLEPVTRRTNILRSPIAPAAVNALKTHCPQGHPYDEVNTYVQRFANGNTGRICRTCNRAATQARYAAHRASKAVSR